SGQVIFDGSFWSGTVGAGSALTIASNITVRTGNFDGSLSGAITNRGVLLADGRGLTMTGSSLVNEAALSIQNGGTISVPGILNRNSGVILLTGGAITSSPGSLVNE